MAIAGVAVRKAGTQGVEGPGGAAPSSLAVDQETSSNSLVRFTWTDPVESGKSLQNVQVYFGSSQQPTAIYGLVNPGTESVSITTGFAIGEVVYARLKATYDDDSESDYTSSVGIAIAQPQSLVGSGEDGGNNFTASATGSPDSHRLYFGTSTGVYTSMQDSDDAAADISIPAGSEVTQYAVMVGVINGVESAYSDEASSTSNDISAPSAPTLTSATPSGSNVTLVFSNPGDADHTYTRIYRRFNGGAYSIIEEDTDDAITSPYVDSGLASGTYDYYMTAGDDKGGSAAEANWSDPSTVRQAEVGAPNAPTFDSISTTPATVVAGDSPSITIAVTPGDGTVSSVQAKLGPVRATSESLTAVDSGSPYTQAVLFPLNQPEALNVYADIITTDANSPYYLGPETLTVNPLGTATLTAESDGGDPDAITLEWSAVTGMSVTYELQVQATGGDWQSLVVDETSATSPFSVGTSILSASTAYDWRVRAVNGDVTGLWSSVDTFTTGS